MIRKAYLLVVIAFTSLLALPQSSVAQENVALLNHDTCFKGTFANYERWMTVISGGSSDNTADFEERLAQNRKFWDKEQFQRYQKTIDCQTVMYKVDDSLVNGFYIAPVDKSNLPVVIYNRGGNAHFGAWMFGNVYLRLFEVALQHDVAIFATNYRGVYPKLPGSDEFGGADVKDVLALPQLFSEFPAINPENVAVYGGSRGAMQSLLAIKHGLNVDAAVLYAGDYDLIESLEHRPEMEKIYRERIPNYADHKVDALKQRSALYWVDELDKDTPILLIHGDQDESVRVGSSIELNQSLEKHGFKHKLSIYEGLGHRSAPKRDEIVAEMIGWFKQHWQ